MIIYFISIDNNNNISFLVIPNSVKYSLFSLFLNIIVLINILLRTHRKGSRKYIHQCIELYLNLDVVTILSEAKQR